MLILEHSYWLKLVRMLENECIIIYAKNIFLGLGPGLPAGSCFFKEGLTSRLIKKLPFGIDRRHLLLIILKRISVQRFFSLERFDLIDQFCSRLYQCDEMW